MDLTARYSRCTKNVNGLFRSWLIMSIEKNSKAVIEGTCGSSVVMWTRSELWGRLWTLPWACSGTLSHRYVHRPEPGHKSALTPHTYVELRALWRSMFKLSLMNTSSADYVLPGRNCNPSIELRFQGDATSFVRMGFSMDAAVPSIRRLSISQIGQESRSSVIEYNTRTT